MPRTDELTAALAPLRADPAASAILLDVDGTLAPIVPTPEQAAMPETTRRPLIDVAKRYGVVACVSGRRAADARRVVGLGSIAYLGSHGSELLRPGGVRPELDHELRGWAQRMKRFAAGQDEGRLRRLRVRLEDKEAIIAFHWRGAPDEDAALAEVQRIAAAAEAAELRTHWGRKVLEVRPPVRIDKGAGIVRYLADRQLTAALYAGDDATDLDAFRGLTDLQERGTLKTALRVAVRSDEGPSTLTDAADLVVDGTDGVRSMLRGLLELE